MARLRNVKPQFFRHEGLQDLESENPGKYCMLVFIGLWGHCDTKGRFEWKPRQLKLDILPFLTFDMKDTLALLESAGVLFKYEVEGTQYGCIPSFPKHQRFSGKEVKEGKCFPAPPNQATEKDGGNDGGANGEQEGSDGEAPGKPPVALECLSAEYGVLECLSAGVRARDPAPHDLEGALQAFRDHAEGLDWLVDESPPARTLAQIRSHLREPGGLDRWKVALGKARAAPFLRGEQHDKRRGAFRMSLDWFAQPHNFSKILAGTYDQTQSKRLGGITGHLLASGFGSDDDLRPLDDPLH